MYFRFQLSGTIAGIEVFTVNPTFDVEGELTENWDQPTANAMVAAAAAVDVPTSMAFAASTLVEFTEVRIEGRSSTDDSLLGVAVATYSGAQPPGSATANKSPQSSVVISLRTDSPGASGRGRMYWPALNVTLGSNLRIATADRDGIAAAAAEYLNGVQEAMEAAAATLPPWSTLPLAVRSKTTLTTPHVVRLMVGDVLDTQRRRRDALPENYTSLAYPPT